VERTESGLVVPDGTIQKEGIEPPNKETWPKADVEKLERLAKALDDAGRNVEILFNCIACRAAKKPSVCHPLADMKTGEIVLVCSCTMRRLSKSI